jgi:hypothetical protein
MRDTHMPVRLTVARWLKHPGVDSFTAAKLIGHANSGEGVFINGMGSLLHLPELPTPGSQWRRLP